MKRYTVKDLLNEMAPSYLHNEELPMQELTEISNHQLTRAYNFIENLGNSVSLYQNKIHNGFVSGVVNHGVFRKLLFIATQDTPPPVMPKQLKNVYQVVMVMVDKRFAEQRIALQTYVAIAKRFDLVSDYQQYLGAKALWKSLARRDDVNVYVFDGNNNDYMSDISGKIIKYNGKNIDDMHIWGQAEHHKSILLVATTKELK